MHEFRHPLTQLHCEGLFTALLPCTKPLIEHELWRPFSRFQSQGGLRVGQTLPNPRLLVGLPCPDIDNALSVTAYRSAVHANNIKALFQLKQLTPTLLWSLSSHVCVRSVFCVCVCRGWCVCQSGETSNKHRPRFFPGGRRRVSTQTDQRCAEDPKTGRSLAQSSMAFPLGLIRLGATLLLKKPVGQLVAPAQQFGLCFLRVSFLGLVLKGNRRGTNQFGDPNPNSGSYRTHNWFEEPSPVLPEEGTKGGCILKTRGIYPSKTDIRKAARSAGKSAFAPAWRQDRSCSSRSAQCARPNGAVFV